ncbi:NAD-dependent epimerase [Paenibacillaceae bacterium]|nr:NAD-dependent epimerase [Paenibacillaceae bacterium]
MSAGKGPILVTGAAGFIGAHLAERLLREGREVVGIDNLNDYYDPALKQARLHNLSGYSGFTFYAIALEDTDRIDKLFRDYRFTEVVNLAAQAGVRYSLTNPRAYIQSNIVGFLNILEACRDNDVQHLVYASSSSVYGLNGKMPFAVGDTVDHPVSLYAGTKKSNELMAHTYSHLYGLPTTGLRFFTVYGPWGRPDMAYYSFTQAIVRGEPIKVYNYGKMRRDFTYIDDIVEGIVRVLPQVPAGNPQWDRANPDPGSSSAPYRVFNIGNNQPEQLTDFIALLEKHLGLEAKKEFAPMQPGDVEETFADVDALIATAGFKPSTSLDEGLGKFVRWYKEYHHVKV